jgi:ADP-heptose:LPS heptosyltransferase
LNIEARPLKVLFFSHDSKLGDAIVNTAFVAGLRRADPGCEIHATVAGATDGFWSQDERIGKRWRAHKAGWRELLRVAFGLRGERYDYIVTWQRMRSEKNRLLLWIARPGAVIDLHEFNQREAVHRIEACGEALAQMQRRGDAELAYDIRAAARCELVERMFAQDREVIVVNLFAADAERNISRAPAAALLRGLRALAPAAALCLVCTDQSESAAVAVLDACGGFGQVVNCEGKLNRLFHLCQRADLVISPDTALVHVASAFDRPVIGIYQNDGVKSAQWGPRSRRAALVLSESATSLEGFSVERVLALAAGLRR